MQKRLILSVLFLFCCVGFVYAGNTAPIFGPITDIELQEEQPYSFVVGASDDEGQPINLTIAGLPGDSGIEVVVDQPGHKEIQIDVDTRNPGVFELNYDAYDDKGGHAEATAHLQILPSGPGISQAPLNFNPLENQVIKIGELISFPVSVESTDQVELNLDCLGLPAESAEFVEEVNRPGLHSGIVYFMPNENQVGRYTIQFHADNKVHPEGRISAIATVRIVVEGEKLGPIVIKPKMDGVIKK